MRVFIDGVHINNEKIRHQCLRQLDSAIIEPHQHIMIEFSRCKSQHRTSRREPNLTWFICHDSDSIWWG
ncbi:hypothetical protein HMPREF0294_0802 [Corynebacterium glucuronolyticum ATCC 51867]|nr:hypothetical protein HMPREF0294_0802 [Corynebacterium glucuronolyticum ATCC 51867]